MRVGVFAGDPAVGRPAGVPEPDRAGRQVGAGLANLADRLLQGRDAIAADGDPPGVIAAILELAQPLQHDLGRVRLPADITEDAAHATDTPSSPRCDSRTGADPAAGSSAAGLHPRGL